MEKCVGDFIEKVGDIVQHSKEVAPGTDVVKEDFFFLMGDIKGMLICEWDCYNR